MPGPYSAGTIFLQIVPSFRGVPEAIAREGREMARQLGGELDKASEKGVSEGIKKGVAKGSADSKGAVEKAGEDAGDQYAGKFRESMRKSVTQVQRELGAIKVDVNDRAARQKFDALKKAAANLSTDIDLGVNSGYLMLQFQKVLGRIEDIQDAAKDIELRANTASIAKDMAGVAAGLHALSAYKIEPELKIDRQMGAFEKQFKAGIARMLDDLPPINLEVDVNDATSEVLALRAQIIALNDIDLSIDANVEQALIEMARIEGRAKAIGDNAINIRTQVDARAIETTAAEIRAKLNEAARINVQLDLEPGAFQSEVRKAIADAQASIGDLEINLDLADDATAAIQRIKRELAGLGDKRIGIDIGAATLLAQLQAAETELDRISQDRTVSFDVRTNASVAASQLRSVRDDADKIDGRNLNLDVDVDGIRNLDRSLTKTVGSLRGLRAEMARSSAGANDNANSFRAFNIRVLGVAALGPAVVPVLAAIGGGLLALGPLAVGAAAGLGVLTLGLWGVGDALKAMGDVQTNAAQDAKDHAEAVRTAATGLRDAERNVADARTAASRSSVSAQEAVESALAGVATAERGVADARQQAAADSERALQGVQDAEKDLADAQRSAQRAQEDLAQARRDAIEEMEDHALSVRGGALAERDAVLDLKEAQDDLNEARASGVGGEELERYILKLDQAQFRLDSTRESNEDLRLEAEEYARTGVEGSDRVVSARERVEQAEQGIATAQRRVADAQAALTQANVDGARRIQDAQKDVLDAQAEVASARRDQAEQAVDSQRRIEDAQLALTDAQTRYNNALAETSTSQQKLLETMAKLGPAGQTFVKYLDGLRPFIDDLKATAQEGFLPGFQEWIDSMVGYHGPLLKRTVQSISGAVGDMFSSFGESMRGNAFTEFFEMIERDGPRFIGYISDVLVNIGEGLASLITASVPLADIFGPWLVDITRDWADAMRDLSSNTGFQSFIEYVRRILPEVEAFFAALVRAVVNLAIALAPYAEGLLNVLTGILDFIGDLDPSILGPIAVGLIGLVLALQAIFGVTAAFVQIRVAAHLIGITGAAGGAAEAAGGLARQFGFLFGAAGLIIVSLLALYTSNEDFRDSVNKLLGAIGDVVAAIFDALLPVFDALVDIVAIVGTAVAEVLAPILGGLADIISNNADFIGALVAGFIAFRGILAITAGIGALSAAFKGLAASMALVSRAQITAGIGSLLGGGAGAAGGAGLLARAGGIGAIGSRLAAGAGLGYVAASGFGGLSGSDPNDNYDRDMYNGVEEFFNGVFQNDTFTNSDVSNWAQQLAQGGAGAASIRERIAADQAHNTGGDIADGLDFWNESSSDRIDQFNAANQAAGEYYRSLDSLSQAQASANYWQNELNYRMGEGEASAEDVTIAQERYEYWTNRVATAQNGASLAVGTTTRSIQEQNDLLRAQYDTQFAYEQATRGVEDAQRALQDAYAMGSGTAEERALREQAIADALVQVEQATVGAADAAKAAAEVRYQDLPEQERARLANAAFVAELDKQKAIYGELPPALQELRDSLAASLTPADMLRVQFDNLGLAVESIPDDKSIVISADTAPDRLQELRDMGFLVTTLPDGRISVTAQTLEASQTLEALYESWRNRPLVITAEIVEQAVAVFAPGGAGFDPRNSAGRAMGGAIFGPGTGTSDSILARVSNGEYVVRAAAVKAVGLDYLQQINSLGGYRDGGPVRKQAFPAFADGGYVANFGGAISVGDLGGIGNIFMRGISQAVQIVAAGSAMMSDLFRTLSVDMSASAKLGAQSLPDSWGPAFNVLAGEAIKAAGAVRVAFGSLQVVPLMVNLIAAAVLGSWTLMTTQVSLQTQNLVKQNIGAFLNQQEQLNAIFGLTRAQLVGAWLGTTTLIRQFTTDTVNFVIAEFNRLNGGVLGATAVLRGALTIAWGQIPGAIQRPVNFIIGEVLNKGLFNAFNSIVRTMGLNAAWNIPAAPLAPSFLAAGGRVPGWSPHDRADNIPAMLTAGEFVQPVDVVQYYGSDFMEALRRKKINPMDMYAEGNPRRYATGGHVLPAGTVQHLAYGGVMSHVAASGDEIQRIFGRLPGGIGGVGARANASDHPKGLALDFMTLADRGLGDRIADYLYANAARMALSYEIFTQRIRYPGGPWRGMENRGSPTANHMDHVHASYMARLGMTGTDPGGGGIVPMLPAWYTEFGSPDGVRGRLDESTLGALKLYELFGFSNATGIIGQMPRKAVDNIWSAMGPEVTKMFAQAAAGAVSGAIGAIAPNSTASGKVVDIVREVARSRGWADGNEWNALSRLITKESGFNPNAQNPTSTAYGLFQFLNSTWAGTGIGKTSDPRLQTEAGLRYIASRYKTPSGALAFHNANNWYSEGGEVGPNGAVVPELHDAGGVLGTGLNILMNKTRRPEVSLPITPDQLQNLVRVGEQGGGGGPLIGELNLPMMTQATPESVASEVVHRISVARRGGRY